MNKRRIVITLAFVGLALGAISFSQRPNTSGMGTQAQRLEADAMRLQPLPPRQLPEHLPYEFLFRRIQFLTEKKMPAARLSALLQEELGINAAQAERLERAALLCLEDVKRQDARAKVVIERIRARYPNGVIRQGQELPDDSPELKVMQQERNAMFLRARSSLQADFGDESFKRFDEKVRNKVDNVRTIKQPSTR
jgi:hypothetical protein